MTSVPKLLLLAMICLVVGCETQRPPIQRQPVEPTPIVAEPEPEQSPQNSLDPFKKEKVVKRSPKPKVASRLTEELERKLPPGMSVPEPIRLLYAWIEERGLYSHDTDNSEKEERRIGYLYPGATWSGYGDEKKFFKLHPEKKMEWSDEERPGGTIIRFVAEGNDSMERWLGLDDPELVNRLCVFAKTGGEGSCAAFWLDDDGQQRIVHLGSGSGSTLMCVLADNPVDFLRLIAIGYDEICGDWAFTHPPNQKEPGSVEFVHPNRPFQKWVRTTFQVTIPRTALKIVKHPAQMDDEKSDDPFFNWVKEHQ